MNLRSRLFIARDKRPRIVSTPVRNSSYLGHDQHYPLIECMLDDAKLQSYVHDCKVTVQEGVNTYGYHVFFKRHCRLVSNLSLQDVENNDTALNFRGDMLVMRLSITGNKYVNLRGRDVILTNFIAKE